jgi:hypothetical protein
MAERAEAAIDRRWQPGETVVLRYLTRDGRPGMSWPCLLASDRHDLLALYIPRGVTYKNWENAPAPLGRHLADAPWRSDVLRLMFPGRGYSVWLHRRPGDGDRFTGYYVNFEEPFRRTGIGFDTNDHTLDIRVAPDGRWEWKDAEEFQSRVRQGIYSAEFAAELRAEAQEVIAAIEGRRPPFYDGWEEWTPDSAWQVPLLPPSWDAEPVALWERRLWAYPAER